MSINQPWSSRARLVVAELNGKEVARFMHTGPLVYDRLRTDTAHILARKGHVTEAYEVLQHPDRVSIHWHEVTPQ
jgi:hypothetical protein